MPSVDLEIGTIHYEEAGPRDGRPILCLHGLMMAGDLWADVAGRLAERGLRVVIPTWPLGAHRTAMRPGADTTPAGVARAVAEFADTLGLEDTVLLGNDSGGAVSQLVAAHHGERVGALALTNCDTLEHFPPASFKAIVVAARRPRAWRTLIAPLRSASVRRSPAAFGLLSHGDLDHLASGWVEPMLTDDAVREDVRRFTAGFGGEALFEATELLRASSLPVLLAWGTDDRLFPVAHAEALAERLPEAGLERIPGSRTLPMIDQPARLAELVAAFAQSSRSKTYITGPSGPPSRLVKPALS